MEEQKETGWYQPDEFRMYDPALGRFLMIDPVVKHHESLYAWNTNNPLLYADPSGADSTQRADALAKAEEFVSENPGDSYEYGAKGDPGENVDCSGLTSECVVAGGEKDPINTGTGGGVKRTAANTKEINASEVVPGTLVIMNGETHIGIVKTVEFDGDGNISNLQIIDSGGQAGSGESGPRYTDLVTDGTANSNFSIDGYRKFDTKPDVQKQPPAQISTKNSKWSRVPSFTLFGITHLRKWQ